MAFSMDGAGANYANLVKMRIYNVEGHVLQPEEFGEPSEVAHRLTNAFFGQRAAPSRPRSAASVSPIGASRPASYRCASRATRDDDIERSSVVRHQTPVAGPQSQSNGGTLGNRCRRMLSAQIRRKVLNGVSSDSVDVDRLIDSLLFRPVTALNVRKNYNSNLNRNRNPRAQTAIVTRADRRAVVDTLLLQRNDLASRVHVLESELGAPVFSRNEKRKNEESDEEDNFGSLAPEASLATRTVEGDMSLRRTTLAGEPDNAGQASPVKSVTPPVLPPTAATPRQTAEEKAREELYSKLKDDSFLGMCTFDCAENCDPSQKPTVSKSPSKQVEITVAEEKPAVQEQVHRAQYGLAFAIADIARKVIDNEDMGITTHQGDESSVASTPSASRKVSINTEPRTDRKLERAKDAVELLQEVQQIRKKRRQMMPIDKLRAAVKLVKYLIQATTTSKQIESKKEARLLTFAELQQSIADDIQESDASELVFNPSLYKACKEVRLGEEAKEILSIHPNSRSERDQQLALIALNQSVQAFSEFPLKMQHKLVQVGWYEKFGHKRVIIRQGHTALKFYFILSGSAVVSVSRHNKKTGESYTETVAILKKGNTFGELALMYGGRRSATITSKEEIELLSLSRDDFVDIFMNLKADSEPEHINFLRGCTSLKHFPIDVLPYDDPKTCLFMYFRRNTVLCRDSNNSEWIYIIKTGSCRVMKDLRVPEHYLEDEIGVNLLSGNMTNPEREKQMSHMKFVAPPNMFPPSRYLEIKTPETKKKAKSASAREGEDTNGLFRNTEVGMKLSSSRRPKASNKKIGANKKVFVQIQKLEQRDVFTLLPIAFDFMGDSTSVSLISDGAECVLINKIFFKKHCSETYLGWLRHTLQPYPREAVMQLNLEDYTWWRFYKQQLVENIILHQQMMSEYILNT